jgi:cytidine deaminase
MNARVFVLVSDREPAGFFHREGLLPTIPTVTKNPHGLDPALERSLIEASLDARERAYAPYSRFQVGAALLAEDGTVYAGCNVENASYGLCLCAERGAVAHAVARGARRFRAIAISTASSPPSSPCGMCRQVLAEMAPGITIVLCNPQGEITRVTIEELLPMGFDARLLESGQASSPSTPMSRGARAASSSDEESA